VIGQAGYATYAVQSNGWLEQSFGFQQGFEQYVFTRGTEEAQRMAGATLWAHGDRILEEATRQLDRRDRDRPFVLYLHFMDVHEYAAPSELRTFGTGRRGFYLASIRWTDDTLRRLREELQHRGLLGNTILILASDHGETFGENQTFGHAVNVFSSVLRVPLIIRVPFAVGGRRVGTQVRNVDIAPTILELAGAPVPEAFEGESLLPLLGAAETILDRPSFADLPGRVMQASRLQAALNDGSWTLVRDLDDEGREYLFDLSLDPNEDANLLEFEPEVAARMRETLDAHQAVGVRDGTSEQDVRIDPNVAERLKAVGYFQ
jgi:arylsulfatase A-like enzyme